MNLIQMQMNWKLISLIKTLISLFKKIILLNLTIKIIKKNRDISLNATLNQTRLLFIRNSNANRNLFVATLIKKSRLPVFPLCDPKIGPHFCSSYNCILWSQNRTTSTILVEESWAFYKRNTTFKNAIIF